MSDIAVSTQSFKINNFAVFATIKARLRLTAHVRAMSELATSSQAANSNDSGLRCRGQSVLEFCPNLQLLTQELQVFALLQSDNHIPRTLLK